MKKWRILLAALLAVTMICTLIACGGQKNAAGKPATITFYNNGQVYETITATTGEKLTLPEAPKAEKGLGLAGWSTIDGDVEEIIDPETFVVYGDMSLYAVWADVFTVTINADNGTPFEVKEVLAGTTLEKPADPVKEGCRFVEWRDALQDVTFDFNRPIYNDVILKAMYGDGSPNRVSDTKWDFSGGIHGAWIGAQGGWKYEVNGLRAEDMVYKTTEDGYAAWGFTLTDSLDNIPEVNGNNAAGLGMKYIYNEGISVEASKAKLVVIYLKPKYYPIDMATSPEDQFRISVLTSNGGMIYGYGNGSEAWSMRTDGAGANLIQVDQMEDGWLRVQFKIHKLDVWSEDAIVKSMAISFVQRKSNPVMDIISVKSIELLDQEEFVDAHQAERTTKSEWDMSNSKDAADWSGYHAKKKNDSLSTKVTDNGMSITYNSPGNGWKGIVLENALLDISKLTGKLSFTYSSTLPITSYRIHILTDLGGKLTANGTEECYVAANVGDIEAGKLPAWRRTVNADGSYTVHFDLNSLDYYANGSELKGLTIVTVTANKVTGTITYKSIEIEKDLSGHDCEAEGHYMKEASCLAPMTCYVCGATEGTIEDHTWEAATCQHPKTCSVCRKTEGTVSSHKWSAATCQKPMTCTVCGQQYGAVAAHKFAEGFCSVCGIPEVIRTEWDMRNAKAAADWNGYHAKKKNDSLTTTVTSAGFGVQYQNPGNGWKGIILEKTAIATDKLTGKLTFTYSSDMPITSYRIHILTDRGGKLTANGTADCYVDVKIADITAGKLEAWTQTTNSDGSVTVTFDLSTLGYFDNGKELRGLTIVTVTANKVIGTVTYKTIALELDKEGYDCQADGHMMKDATCTEPKTCRVCGATEGEALGHTWADATCASPKTCTVCGETEGEPNAHVDADGDYKCDNCGVEYCSNHNWADATCQAPKTCSNCGATEGSALPHADSNKDHVCDVCTESLTVWYMNTEADASQWQNAQSYVTTKPSVTTAEVTADGFKINYLHDNGWKGIYMKDVDIDIAGLSGMLSFTYTEEMDITEYRIHVLTDKGGSLEDNTSGTPSDYYAAIAISNIAQSSAWTQTINADGSITVTFDLTTLPFFAEGTKLLGMDIVTVTARGTKGTVTYKLIALDNIDTKHNCQQNGHNWRSATCTEPKTCTACGIIEGKALGHTWVDADCVAAKTCSVCGETEGEALGHNWVKNVCLKTCYTCGATESTSVAHTYENGSCSVCGTKSWDTDSDGILEILTIGNSFSVDATEYSWRIANALGIEKIVVGNLYIGSCSLNTHMANANGDIPNYRYYYCDDGNWTSTEGYKLSTALESRDWDFVSLQQASGDSGVESTYNADLTNLVAYIKARSDAKLVWHMTWAYQQDSTHNAFPTYGSDQMTMYNAIVSAVQNKVVPNGNFALIVPNGTAVQNARTSLIGDTLTRDGYHMSKDFGRYLTGLMLIKTVTGLDISGITYVPSGVSSLYRNIAVESVNNAYAKPFAVTQSAYQSMGDVVIRNSWDMSNAEEAADWGAYHNKIKDNKLSAEVTANGFSIDFEAGNGWRAVILEETAIDISKLTGKLTFTYSTDMKINTYRIHILTDVGGKLTSNGDSWYAQENVSAITPEGTGAWTQTVNADGTITVTFDLSTLSCFAEGRELKGLSIVTATANSAVGNVTFKSIELVVDVCKSNGHTWADATCTAPKTCSVCGATEGEPLEHSWKDATCQTPKTCTACGATEGNLAAHTFENGVCTVCGTPVPPTTATAWDMSNEEAVADWGAYHNKIKDNKLSAEVTANGFSIDFEAGNGWRAVILEKAAIDISKLTGKLTFTYSTDMKINTYRIHILTDVGGKLTSNGDSWYAQENVSAITPEGTGAWTQTIHADGTITVTFDLSTLSCFAEGKELKGLSIVTATANSAVGNVTFKSIALEESPCWSNGHTWSDATCQAPKTCDICGKTEGETADHTFAEGVCTVCGAEENIPTTPIVWNMSNAASASQWQSAQAYTSVKPEVTVSEVTADGFKASYFHKNGWKGIVMKNVQYDITGLSLLSFTYIEEMDITHYRVHVLTDKGGDLGSNTSGTPSDYYAAVSLSDIAQSAAWTRTVNADGSITVTFDLTTLPFFKEGTKLLGMDIVTVTATGTTGKVTYKSIAIR